MWVQGGTSRSKHIEAIPIALSSPNCEPEPTQSVLSLSVTPFNVATTHPLKKKMQTAAASTSDLLAHVEPGLGRRRRVFPHLAGKALGAVAPLEDFQAVRAFLPLLGAHLALPQHRLADLGPEVTGAAVALRTVGRTQTRVALVP